MLAKRPAERVASARELIELVAAARARRRLRGANAVGHAAFSLSRVPGGFEALRKSNSELSAR